MSRRQLVSEKAAEIAALGGLAMSEVSPSRRDFALFASTQKTGIAIIPHVKRQDPATGRRWAPINPAEMARAFDGADAPAIAVATSALYGGTIDDLRAVAHAGTAPVLRDDYCLAEVQLYQSRLNGADAVILPGAELDPARLQQLARVSASMHMSTVIEVESEEDLPSALDLPAVCVGIRGDDGSGYADCARIEQIARQIPASRTVLLLSEPSGPESLLPLVGLIDAALIGELLLGASDPAAALAGLMERFG